jgi:hypothetical protein
VAKCHIAANLTFPSAQEKRKFLLKTILNIVCPPLNSTFAALKNCSFEGLANEECQVLQLFYPSHLELFTFSTPEAQYKTTRLKFLKLKIKTICLIISNFR